MAWWDVMGWWWRSKRVKELERYYVVEMLRQKNGNREEAARVLGISLRRLEKYIRESETTDQDLK